MKESKSDDSSRSKERIITFVQCLQAANFNINGAGTIQGTLIAGGTVNGVHCDIGGFRVLSNPGLNNLFAGVGAGASNTIGDDTNKKREEDLCFILSHASGRAF